MPLSQITTPSESSKSPNYLPFFTQLNCGVLSDDSTSSSSSTDNISQDNTNNEHGFSTFNSSTVIETDPFSINQNTSSTNLIIPSIPPIPTTNSLLSPCLTSEENFTLIDTDPLSLLRQYIDINCHSPVIGWTSELLFNGSINGGPLKEVDILKFVGKQINFESHKIYFCNITYSVKDELESIHNLSSKASLKEQYSSRFKSEAFRTLSKDISAASRKCGFEIIKNGVQGYNNSKGMSVVQRFSCRRYQLYRNKSNLKNTDDRYRLVSYHNDRQNQRPKGRKLCRRTFSNLTTTQCLR